MSRVIWLHSALADIGEQVEYIARDNPAAAQRVSKKLRTIGASLGVLKTGRIGQVPGTYERVLTDLPYLVVYSIGMDADGREAVIILRVIHTARLWPPVEE